MRAKACSASVRCGLQPLCLQRCMHFAAAVLAMYLLNNLDSHLRQEPGHWVRMKQAMHKTCAGQAMVSCKVVACQ